MTRAWLMAVALLGAGSAAAADAPARSAFTVPDLVAQVQRDSKDLQAARYAVALGQARLAQAGLRPSPVLELRGQNDALFGHEGEYSQGVAISQAFPIAGRLLREKDVARVDVALAEAEVAEAERQMADATARDGYRLQVQDEQLANNEALIAAEQPLAKATRERFRAAEVSELDVNAVRLDLQRLEQERNDLQRERAAVIAALNTRLGRAADAPLAVVAVVPEFDELPTLTALQARALAQRPDLRSAQLGVDRAAAERALAQAERWDDWSVGLELSQDRLALDGGPPQRSSRALGFSLSIPLPLTQRTRGRVDEAQAARDQAEARVAALQLAIGNDVAAAHAQLAQLSAALARYDRDTAPLVARNVRLAQEGYRQGLVPLADVVQAQRQQAEAITAHLQTLDHYLQAWTDLQTATAEAVARPSGATP